MSRNLDTVINGPMRNIQRFTMFLKTLQRQTHTIKSTTAPRLKKRQEPYCQILQQ